MTLGITHRITIEIKSLWRLEIHYIVTRFTLSACLLTSRPVGRRYPGRAQAEAVSYRPWLMTSALFVAVPVALLPGAFLSRFTRGFIPAGPGTDPADRHESGELGVLAGIVG